jgi:phage terminase large subunit GpA-like protein
LPEGVSSLTGKVRLWPPQREIADAIGDSAIERVTLVKPVRVGFSMSVEHDFGCGATDFRFGYHNPGQA